MSLFFVLSQIVLIDLTLAADNALVVGFLVASLPKAQRKRAVVLGIAAATVLRVLMAFFALELLHITGLVLAGGILLVWVAWKLMRDFRHLSPPLSKTSGAPLNIQPKKTAQAIWQIVVADFSMSLDNVLGIAGVARDHKMLLVLGLILSVALMGFAASKIAYLTVRYPKMALIGTAVILYTALHMIYDGSQQVGLFNLALV